MQDQTKLDPDQWVDRHGDVLYRYALLRVRSPETAAELVQETFLAALKARGRFAGLASERTWLVSILRRKVVDHYRTVESRSRLSEEDLSDSPSMAGQFTRRGRWARSPLFWRGNPSADIEQGEFWDAIARCLQSLSPVLAEAFLLREIDGLESAEVCEALGLTPASFWARMHRARLSLRSCLEQSWMNDDHAPRT